MKIWAPFGRILHANKLRPRTGFKTGATALVVFAAIAGSCAMAKAQAAPSAAAAAPSASDATPIAMVKAAIDEATAVFSNQQLSDAEREKQLRAIAARHFDFASMARSAVGYHWRSFTPEQRTQFVPLFTNFIEDVYLSRIESYSVEKVQRDIKSSTIKFDSQRLDGTDYAQVFTTVKLPDRDNPLQVNYMLHRDAGQWRIYDISVNAISVIANYRNQFNRVLNSDGYDKLVSLLRQKSQGLSSTFRK
jgi:phospholipid transport system substrate-binding protein